MKKTIWLVPLVLVFLASGCAFFSANSRNSLLAGDADVALLQNRSAKGVTRASDATNSGSIATPVTAEPTCGGTFQLSLDPGTVSNLMKAASTPSVQSAPSAPVVVRAMPEVRRYTVQKGDTLWGISRQNQTTVNALKRANHLRGDRIYPGQVLVLP